MLAIAASFILSIQYFLLARLDGWKRQVKMTAEIITHMTFLNKKTIQYIFFGKSSYEVGAQCIIVLRWGEHSGAHNPPDQTIHTRRAHLNYTELTPI